MIKYFSLFSGIGGFEYGIQRAYYNRNLRKPENPIRPSETDIRPQGNISNSLRSDGDGRRIRPCCVGFSEIDRYAIQIYKSHFNHKEYGNVQQINWDNVEDFELLVGGFPCQAFSIAGKRRGFGDTRGTLFFEIAKAAQEKQPRLLLLENVKGLLSHDKGKTFGVILNTLDELGYNLQWQVLNSKNFGVPQNRERVFIVGHLRGTTRPQIFPIRENNKEADDIQRPEVISNTVKPDFSGAAACTYIEYNEFPQIRRLTPIECERLQGFPDGWTEGISDTQRYKCLGNAVTVNVVKAIIKKLYA